MSTIIHTHVDVAGALLQDYHDQRRVYMTLSVDGRKCANVREYRAALTGLLSQGIKCLPIGNPCEGFSYETGCPKHETASTSTAKTSGVTTTERT